MIRCLITAAVLAAVLGATTGTASANVSDADFGQQNPSAVVLPLTVKVTANKSDVQFELWQLGPGTRKLLPGSSLRVHPRRLTGERWEIEVTVLRVPSLNAHYSICATGRPSNATCPSGFLHSFYAFDPAFSRSLKVRSSGNTISAQAAFSIRTPSPAGFRISVAVQYHEGAWRTLGRHVVTKGPILSDNDWNAQIPEIKIRRTVPHLQELLKQGKRFRVVVKYRFYTGTDYDIVKPGQAIRDVRAQG